MIDRLAALEELTIEQLVETRYRRYRALGSYTEAEMPEPTPPPAGRGLSDRLRDLLGPGRRVVSGAAPSWSRDEPPAREAQRVPDKITPDAPLRAIPRPARRPLRGRSGRRPRRHRGLDRRAAPGADRQAGATGLAELEVREDSLRVRLRRPAVSAAGQDGRAGERGVRGDRSRGSAAAAASGHPAGLTPVGPGRQGRDGRDGPRLDEPGAVATSPAVGIYQPRAEARAGTKVRAGDRLGTVSSAGRSTWKSAAPTDGLKIGVL